MSKEIWTPGQDDLPESFADSLSNIESQDEIQESQEQDISDCVPLSVKNKVHDVLAGLSLEDLEACINAASFEEAMVHINKDNKFKPSDVKWLKKVFEDRRKNKKTQD